MATHLDEASAGVVALLLDDLAPPRLGTLLRGARKARGLSRREVAQRIGASASDLRRYERGDEPVPPRVVAQLAECYGAALTEQLATRAPIEVESRRMVVGDEVAALDTTDGDEVLGKYVELVSRMRQSQPGEPIALRADDLVALSTAIGLDTDDVEARIVELLGCSPREAKSLHAEMLRRKLVLPVAGFVAGLAIVGGVGVASASNPTTPSPAGPGRETIEHVAPVSHDVAVPKRVVAAPTTLPAATTPTAPTPPAPTTTQPAPAPVDDAPAAEPADDAPVSQPAAEPQAHPVVTPDTTPMGIPPNETVTIIQP
jgi:transcriptional regulator with XRE-family HTH domain